MTQPINLDYNATTPISVGRMTTPDKIDHAVKALVAAWRHLKTQ